jgi:hypothetical protein
MYSKDDNHRSTCLFLFIAIPHFLFERSKEPQRTLSEYELEYAPPKLHHRMYAEHTHSSSNDHLGRLLFFFFFQFCDIENLADFSKNKKN